MIPSHGARGIGLGMTADDRGEPQNPHPRFFRTNGAERAVGKNFSPLSRWGRPQRPSATGLIAARRMGGDGWQRPETVGFPRLRRRAWWARKRPLGSGNDAQEPAIPPALI